MKEKRIPIITEYRKKRALYGENTKKIEVLVSELIKEKDIPIQAVSSRTKSIESLSNKVSRKDKYASIDEITDLSGVRICCYFSSQVEEVAKLIKANFSVNKDLSVDKGRAVDPDRFGYVSLHYIAKLSEKRVDLLEYSKYKDLFCEIQIRTILQHAWAEIEHDLGYKSEIGIPNPIRRQFSRLSGLLELADEQFDNIKTKLESYGREVKKKTYSKPEEIGIDQITVEYYIDSSPTVRDIEKDIERTTNLRLKKEKVETEELIEICKYFHIDTIDKLDSSLVEERHNIVSASKELLEVFGVREEESIERGLSIPLLGMVKIARTANIESIRNFLVSMGAEEPELSEFAKALIELELSD